MRVRIPFDPNSERAKPLQDCLAFAAENMGVSDYFAANLMTWFLEKLAAEVAKGRVVRIPGFGIFAAYPHKYKKPEKGSYVAPVFSAAKGFRMEVRACLPVDAAVSLRAIKNYCKSNAPTSGAKRNSSRVFSAMKVFRQDIDAQARRAGIDAGPRDDRPKVFP